MKRKEERHLSGAAFSVLPFPNLPLDKRKNCV